MNQAGPEELLEGVVHVSRSLRAPSAGAHNPNVLTSSEPDAGTSAVQSSIRPEPPAKRLALSRTPHAPEITSPPLPPPPQSDLTRVVSRDSITTVTSTPPPTIQYIPVYPLPSPRANEPNRKEEEKAEVKGVPKTRDAERPVRIVERDRDTATLTTSEEERGGGEQSSGADTSPPIKNRARFLQLFLAIVVMLVSSIVGTFAIFGFFIQAVYRLSLVNMVDIFAVGTGAGMIFAYLAGLCYDLYAHRLTLGVGVAMVFSASLCLGLTFNQLINGTYARFVAFFFLLNAGAYCLDMVAIITTATHLPRNRGMMCGLLKTITGLGASLFSCLFRGYLYSSSVPRQFSNLFYFLTALAFVFGVVCLVFFNPAPWADIHFYGRVRLLSWCENASARCSAEEIDEKLERFFLLKVPYLKYRLPQRRVRVVFAILLLLNIFMAVQLICVTYLDVTSRASLNGIASVAVVLFLLLTVLVWPFDWLDGPVDYSKDEQDMDEDGCVIPHAAENKADVLHSTESYGAASSAHPQAIGTNRHHARAEAPKLLGSANEVEDSAEEQLLIPNPFEDPAAFAPVNIRSHLAHDHPLTRTDAPHQHTRSGDYEASPARPTSANLTQLLFARNVSREVMSRSHSEAVAPGDGTGTAQYQPHEHAFIVSESPRRGRAHSGGRLSSSAPSSTPPSQPKHPHTAPRHMVPQSVTISRWPSHGNDSCTVVDDSLHAVVHYSPSVQEAEDVTHILHGLSNPPERKRIPINYDSIAELLKHRYGFMKSLATYEMLTLLWMSFTVWSTGLIITSNMFIKLFYASASSADMNGKTYYLYAAISGVGIGVGRVAIGTIADDVLPMLRKKLGKPFHVPFTVLLLVPPWLTVLALILFLAIPPASSLIAGYVLISVAYGLTTSTIPYAVTCFFSFEHVGLGKVYGACLAAAGLGVVTFYRGMFFELLPDPLYPTVPLCLSGKRACMEMYLVITLFLNVLAGIAVILLHRRFQRRLIEAARGQIQNVKASQQKDLAVLHSTRFVDKMRW